MSAAATGWLPKEVLDHLDHAGYVAVPKERVRVLWAEERSSIFELAQLKGAEELPALHSHLLRKLAMSIGNALFKENLVGVEDNVFEDSDDRYVVPRGRVYVVAPRDLGAFSPR